MISLPPENRGKGICERSSVKLRADVGVNGHVALDLLNTLNP